MRAQQHKIVLESEQGRQTLGDVSLIASSLLGSSGDTIEIEGQNHLVQIESVFPGDPVGDYFLVPLEPYPHRNPAWCFIDTEKTRRKRGLCLHMTFKGLTAMRGPFGTCLTSSHGWESKTACCCYGVLLGSHYAMNCKLYPRSSGVFPKRSQQPCPSMSFMDFVLERGSTPAAMRAYYLARSTLLQIVANR